MSGLTLDPDKRRIAYLKPKAPAKDANAIRAFTGDYEFLSPLYKSSVMLPGDDEAYPSVEHAFQASKTEDKEIRAAIRAARTGVDAKKAARGVEITAEWRKRSEAVMELLVREKFVRHPKNKERLMETEDRPLIYENEHNDRIWGVCGGAGENRLGLLLQRIRADISSQNDVVQWARCRFDLPAPQDACLTLTCSKRGVVVETLAIPQKPLVRIGKHPESDVVLENPTASRQHALIALDRSTMTPMLVCLGAANGTFVAASADAPPERLKPFVPRALPAEGAVVAGFGASPRRWAVSAVDFSLRETERARLLTKMADVGQDLPPEEGSTVYVGNLGEEISEPALRELFESCGQIHSVSIPQTDGKPRGIAFVTFQLALAASKALARSGEFYKGNELKVHRAQSKVPPKGSSGADPNDSGRGRGRGGRGRGGRGGDGRRNDSSSVNDGNLDNSGHYGPSQRDRTATGEDEGLKKSRRDVPKVAEGWKGAVASASERAAASTAATEVEKRFDGRSSRGDSRERRQGHSRERRDSRERQRRRERSRSRSRSWSADRRRRRRSRS